MIPEPYRYDSEYESGQDGGRYPYESYYGGGGRRRGGGSHGGWWVLLVLTVIAVGAVFVLSRYSFELRETDGGMSVVIRDGNQTPAGENAGSLMAETPAAPEAELLHPNVPGGGPQLLLGDAPGPSDPVKLSGGGMSLQDIYRKMLPSVVSITSTLRSGAGTGTGIIMSEDGYIITNDHVVDGAVAIEVLTWDDQVFTASLVGSDSTSDLAVLKVESDSLTAAEFGNSDQLLVGDAVVAIGDPLGVKLRGTMTDGIVSAINRDLEVNGRSMTLIQTNAALNNGNSGGPLINTYGQVIGINTMKLSSYYTSATVEGLGFAIPISSAKPIIDELIEKGYVSGRPALGITGKTLPNVYKSYYRLPEGVYVESVDPYSDAYAKGLREGDTIMVIDGTAIRTMEELNSVKNCHKAGDEVQLVIYRGGVTCELTVVLGEAAAK